jgi:glyoxylase I family protein
MEKVTGIGGLFFRAQDPAALGQWYQEHLGVSLTPSSYEDLPWRQEAGPTAFSPFPETSEYFGDSKQVWMPCPAGWSHVGLYSSARGWR